MSVMDANLFFFKVKRHSHIEGGRNQPALDLGLLGVASLGGAESRLDGVDALVAEAGDLDVGTDLGGLGGQPLADVRLDLLGNSVARELDVIPDVGVAGRGLAIVPNQGGIAVSAYVIESLKASREWPYFLLSGQAIVS